MGKIQLPPSPPLGASSSSSASPPDEPLPTYDQVATENNNNYRDDPLSPPATAYLIPGHKTYHSIRQKIRHSGAVTLEPSLSSDPAALESFIDGQTRLPPRPCLAISGNHRESRKNGKETTTDTVTDFDFRIDLTRTLLRWGRNEENGPSHRWSYTVVASDAGGEKAYRGGRWPTRGKKPGRIALPDGDDTEEQSLMDLEHGQDGPGIRGWCERFCSDPAPVKSFTFRRNLHGFDASPMRTLLESHIRSTGYLGNIHISPSIANGMVTIYSPHWINKLRNNAFVFYMCVILQLWIITWPVIWILERRYEVIRSEWFSSQIVSDPADPSGQRKVYAGGHDETQAAEMWAPVVREAAWQQRVGGEILGEAEVEQLRRLGTERRETIGQGSDLIRRGQTLLGTMGIRSIGGVNVTGGWGGDSSSSSSSRVSIRIG